MNGLASEWIELGFDIEIRHLASEPKRQFKQIHSSVPNLQLHVTAIQIAPLGIFHKSTNPFIH